MNVQIPRDTGFQPVRPMGFKPIAKGGFKPPDPNLPK